MPAQMSAEDICAALSASAARRVSHVRIMPGSLLQSAAGALSCSEPNGRRHRIAVRRSKRGRRSPGAAESFWSRCPCRKKAGAPGLRTIASSGVEPMRHEPFRLRHRATPVACERGHDLGCGSGSEVIASELVERTIELTAGRHVEVGGIVGRDSDACARRDRAKCVSDCATRPGACVLSTEAGDIGFGTVTGNLWVRPARPRLRFQATHLRHAIITERTMPATHPSSGPPHL